MDDADTPYAPDALAVTSPTATLAMLTSTPLAGEVLPKDLSIGATVRGLNPQTQEEAIIARHLALSDHAATVAMAHAYWADDAEITVNTDYIAASAKLMELSLKQMKFLRRLRRTRGRKGDAAPAEVKP